MQVSKLVPREDEIVAFVTHSAAIAGDTFDLLTSPSQRHLRTAQNLAVAHRFVPAEILNAELRGITENWLRTGLAPNLRGKCPHPSHVKQLLDEWNVECEEGLVKYINASLTVRENWCWEMHDRLICIRPFQERGGRTARLELNLLRGLLGLPWKIVVYEGTEGYYDHIDTYRTSVFLPWYEDWAAERGKL